MRKSFKSLILLSVVLRIAHNVERVSGLGFFQTYSCFAPNRCHIASLSRCINELAPVSH